MVVAAVVVLSLGAYLVPGSTSIRAGPTIPSSGAVVAVHPAASDPSPLGAFTAYVPIQLTDSGSSVPAGTQLLLNVSTGGYSTLLNSELSNVAFVYPNGTPIDAWLQNFTSGPSGVAQVWLNLTAPVPSGGSSTIVLGFLPLGTDDFSTTGPWGEAPNLPSNSYGSADDGAAVFPAYVNGETPLSAFTYLGTNLSTQSFGASGFVALNATQGMGPEAGFWYLTKNVSVGPLVVQAQFSSRGTSQGAGVAGLCTNLSGAPSPANVTASIDFRYGFLSTAIYLSQSAGTSTVAATTPTGSSNGSWNYATLGYGGLSSLDVNGTLGATPFGGLTQELAFNNTVDPFASPSAAQNLHVCGLTYTNGGASAIWFSWALARTPVPTGAVLSVTYGPKAIPSLTESLTRGGTGTTVDFNGSGYVANATLSTSWSASGPSPTCPASANASGEFSCELTIGTAPIGVYAFNASQAGGTVTATTYFFVDALSVTPPSATPNELVTFFGNGFAPGAAVTTNWSGWPYGPGPACPATANASGDVLCSYLVGYLPAASYVLNVTGSGFTLPGQLELQPALTFAPPNGAPGGFTSVDGFAFAASSPLTYTWPSGFPAVAGCSAVTTPDGNLSCPAFTIPAVPAGTYPLVVRDGEGNSASAVLAVGASLASNVSGAAVGGSVQFQGAGFAASRPVWVNWTGGIACTAETAANGSFSCAFTVPAIAGGPYRFVATDGVDAAAVVVAVLESIRASALALPAGAPLALDISGAPANGTVAVEYEPSVIGLATPLTTPLCGGNATVSGTFSCATSVPYITGGPGEIVSAGPNNTAEYAFTVATRLTLLPSSGPAGSTFIVNGTGWAYYEDLFSIFSSITIAQPVTITWGVGGPSVCTAYPNGVGAFTCAATTVPAQAAGPVELVGTQLASVGYFPLLALVNLTYSASATFTVTTNLTAQFTVGPSSPEAGSAVTFEGTASGGAGSYTLDWTFGDGSSGSGAVNSHTFATAGSYDVTLTVTDALGSTVSTTKVVVVAPPLTVGPIVAAPATIEVGQSMNFSGGALGGVGARTYAWSGLPHGCSAGSVATFQCTPDAPGTYVVDLQITDADHVSASAPPLVVVVVPPLSTPVVSASSSSVASGSSVTFGVSVFGGVGPYSYTWTGLPLGCVAANAPTLTCAPSATGTYAVAVAVVDAFGVVAQSSPVSVAVTSPATTTGSLPLGLAYGQLALVALAVVLLAALLVLLLRAGRGGRPGTLNEYEEPTPPADGEGAKPPPQGSG